ncbi:sensor histidine kinase [Mycobacterium sp.]|uniref:sensor histidine kinase n=1 Tax=Mycobacterium sp. TaxID=1785 RepID=UPI003F9B4265
MKRHDGGAIDRDDYGLARTVVAVRIAVVVSIGVLLLIGPDWVRQHTTATVAVLSAAMLYSLALLVNPRLEVRRTRYAWVVSFTDSVFTLALIWLTGGLHSPVAEVLVLVVIASAARLSFARTLVLAVLVGAGYVAVAFGSPSRAALTPKPWLQAGWAALYLVFVAIMTAGLSALAEREQQSRIRALVEAEAEHVAAEEERDLRARLLQSYQSQQDGLQVLVHEFRTPIASLEALMDAVTANQMSEADRETSLQLAGRHTHHLADMLDALSDVALSRRPTFSTGRVQRVDIADVIVAAADAVALAPPGLRLTTGPGLTGISINAQGLRRVLTNLLENAARHGPDAPVDVGCNRDGDELVIAVADRGPGIPAESLGELTAKYVSAGGQRGTAGLGLWIVQQIVEAMNGRVDFAARDGGGLVATFRAPVE